MKLGILIALILLIIPDASATIIQGKVYDLELNRLNNVVVEIDTVPRQRVISQLGEYFLNVPKGEYSITARALIEGITYSTSEKISIINEGEYTIDLFLFPEITDIKDINSDIYENEDKAGLWMYAILFIIAIIILLFFKIIRAKNKKISNEIIDDDLNNIYKIIKKEKRTTQKEIRKNSSLSEAKISLIITQLEKEGKIQKIKKGRANILILKQ